MKKAARRWISCLMAILMVATLLPAAVFADNGIDELSENESAVVQDLDVSSVTASTYDSLTDGNYTINVEAWHETKDQKSMMAAMLDKDATLEVSGGKVYANIKFIKANIMGMEVTGADVPSVETEVGEGNYVPGTTVLLDEGAGSRTLKVELNGIETPTKIKMIVAPMGNIEMTARLRFDVDSLVEVEEPEVPEPETPEVIQDGKYAINVEAWHETKDQKSMMAAMLDKDATLEVSGGKVYANIKFIKANIMGMEITGADVPSVETEVGEGNYVPGITVLQDEEAGSHTLKVELGRIETPTKIKMIVAPMNNAEMTARLRFDVDSLIRTGDVPLSPDLEAQPVKELTAADGAVAVNKTTLSGLDKLATVAASFDDASVVVPVRVLNSALSEDQVQVVKLVKKQAAESDDAGIKKLLGSGDALVQSFDLSMVTVQTDGAETTVHSLGDKIKVTIRLTADQVSALSNSGSHKLVYYNPASNLLEDTNAAFDLSAKTAVFYTDHLSAFAVVSSDGSSGGGIGEGNGPLDPENLSDGNYTIHVDALKENSNAQSMCDALIQKPVGLEVSNGYIKVTLILKGNPAFPMKEVGELSYQDSDGDYVSIPLDYNESSNTIKVTFPVTSLTQAQYMKVSVPSIMPGKPVFRLIFNTSSLESGVMALPVAVAVVDYKITAEAAEGGTISPNGEIKVAKGKDETFTITANAGYKIKEVIVNKLSVGAVGTYTFDNVESDGKIKAVFEKIADPVVVENKTETNPTTTEATVLAVDLKDISGHWAEKSIRFTAGKGLFNGVAADSFGPDQNMTRGMLATVLGRHYGVDATTYTASAFKDVKADRYYAPYIAWASEKGMISSTGNNQFEPDRIISREELAVILASYLEFANFKLTNTAEPQVSEAAGELSEGQYTIEAKGLQESSDNLSMVNQFIKEPAVLTVANGKISASMVWYGTDFITMDALEELKLQNSAGEFVDVERSLDQANNKMIIKFDVEDISKQVIMQVYVPKGMPGTRPKFRVVWDVNTLTRIEQAKAKVNKLAFADYDQISAWAKDDVTKLQEAGILQGRGNNLFDPKGKATRAEAAHVLTQALEGSANDVEE